MGLSNKQIAARMCLSVATVKRDLALLFQRFECQNRMELVFRATALGYLAPDSTWGVEQG